MLLPDVLPAVLPGVLPDLATLVAPLAALSLAEQLLAVAVVLVAYLVLGLAGFGSALVIVPALAWRWPLTTVVPLVLLLDLPASLLHAVLNRRQVQGRELLRLLPGMAAGVALGAVLAPLANLTLLGAALGAYVVVVALRGLSGQAPAGTAPAGLAPVAGVATGLVEALLGTAGPVVLYWLSRRLPTAHAVRATTPLVFAVVTLLALVGMGFNGQLAQPLVWAAWLPLLPVSWAGVSIGHRLAHGLPAQRLAQVVWAGLGLSGAALLVRALA